MTKFYLINNTRVGTTSLYAGTLVDDAFENVAAMRNAGAVLINQSNGAIAQAAVLATKLRRKGAPPAYLAEIMQSALEQTHERSPKGADIAATATVQWSDGLRRVIAGLAANCTVTLGVAAGADGRLPYAGARWQFTRTDVGAFTVPFVNGGPGAGTLKTLAVSVIGYAEFEFNAAGDWELVQ